MTTKSRVLVGMLGPLPEKLPSPTEQTQLDKLAAMIEMHRERLRPKMGRVSPAMRPDRDYVDTMEWDQLLLFAAFDVLKHCRQGGVEPLELISLARDCWPLTNQRALGWVELFFDHAERHNYWSEADLFNHVRDVVTAREVNRVKAARVAQARAAADARHSQAGGSRDKAEGVRAMWARGQHASRDDLAREVEAQDRGMSFAAAREALKRTPEPDPWPAKAGRSRRTRG